MDILIPNIACLGVANSIFDPKDPNVPLDYPCGGQHIILHHGNAAEILTIEEKNIKKVTYNSIYNIYINVKYIHVYLVYIYIYMYRKNNIFFIRV